METALIRLPNGSTIRVEASSIAPKGDSDVSLPIGLLTTENLSSAIEGLSELMLESLKKVKPTKASVELALEIAVESGKLTALWVKGSGKANLKVTLEWGGGLAI
jgi:hypothetical protein